jgi:hypothetical protein
MPDPEDGRMNGEHVDEGVVHAWLDGQLPAADAARIESHITACAACAALVAEARGFVAASSRILTGLDGVPSRVVPRSRSRARMWQVRAAAAVVVVALGAAAVLSDAGGHFSQLRRETAASQPTAAPHPAESPAPAPEMMPVPPALAPAARSRTAAPPRAAAPAPAPETSREKKEAAGAAVRADAMQESRQSSPAHAAPPPSGLNANVVTGSAGRPPASQQDSSGNAPFTASRAALAAKSMQIAPQGAAQGGTMRMRAYDSSARADVAGMLDARRIASGAYRECAGKVVIIPGGDSGAGAPAHVAAVRLDSAVRTSPARGFVVTAPGGDAPRDGWWLPAGADSAVVSLVTYEPASGAPVSSDSGVAGAGGVPPVVKTAVMTRVRCSSP